MCPSACNNSEECVCVSPVLVCIHTLYVYVHESYMVCMHCVYVHMCTCCICVCMHHVCLPARACTRMWVCMYGVCAHAVSVCKYSVHVDVWMYLCICVSACIVSACAYAHIVLYMHVLCVRVYVHVHTCLCMRSVCVCVCFALSLLSPYISGVVILCVKTKRKEMRDPRLQQSPWAGPTTSPCPRRAEAKLPTGAKEGSGKGDCLGS